MDYTLDAIQEALGQQALSFFGEGVLVTTQYPSPFPITMSGLILGGSVGPGVAYDPNGQITEINGSPDEPVTFTITPADPTNPRWDLLVLRYQMVGDTLVPKPSDPITNIDLNLHDDFMLAVIEGTPSGTPAYPSKGDLDIILAGLQVPPGSTLGTDVTVDLSIRDIAQPFIATMPVFIDEQPDGNVDGVNVTFTISKLPISAQSVLVFQNDLKLSQSDDYSIAGQTITLNTPPPIGSTIRVWYIENSPLSENPLAGSQLDIGSGTGSQNTFPFSGTPTSQASVMVFVDGIKSDPTEWSLLLGNPNSSIVFNNAPSTGQNISIFFLLNAAAIGIGPSSSGVQSVVNNGTGAGTVAIGIAGTQLQLRNIKAGTNATVTVVGNDIVIGGPASSTGGYVVYGYPSAIVIDPTVAITTTTDQRQMQFIRSTVGAQAMASTPQVESGTTVGQELLFFGTDDTNFIVLQDGNGLALNGAINLKKNQSLVLTWNGTVWAEIARR